MTQTSDSKEAQARKFLEQGAAALSSGKIQNAEKSFRDAFWDKI